MCSVGTSIITFKPVSQVSIRVDTDLGSTLRISEEVPIQSQQLYAMLANKELTKEQQWLQMF